MNGRVVSGGVGGLIAARGWADRLIQQLAWNSYAYSRIPVFHFQESWDDAHHDMASKVANAILKRDHRQGIASRGEEDQQS